MFAKPKGKQAKNDRGQVNTMKRNSRPLTMPDFLRSDPNGELAALYMRVKTASAKPPKQPAKQKHFDMTKRTIPDEYINVRSPVGDYIQRPFIAPAGKPKIEESFWKEIPPVPVTRKEQSQKASIAERDRRLKVCNVESPKELGDILEEDEEEKEVEIKIVGDNEKEKFELVEIKPDMKTNNIHLDTICTNRRNHINLAFATGMVALQQCEKTTEVFKCYAETFHDVLEIVTYGPKSCNVSTQTISPRLQRTQLSLIYAGFWEGCIWRKNQGVQTNEQNLTFENRSTVMNLTNSNISGSSHPLWKFFNWKCIVLVFFVSAIFLILVAFKNLW
jgi:hypothetical protein